MGRIWGARKPVTRLRNIRFWAWYLQQKRKARSLAKPCLDDLIGWFKFDTTNNSGDTELVNSVDDGDNITVHGFAATWDGAENLDASHLTGSETVVDSTGTSTPSVSSGSIDFTSGYCGMVELSNGDIFILESKENYEQPTAYNIGNIGSDATYSDVDISTKINSSYLAENGFNVNKLSGVDLVLDKDWPTT